MDLTVENIREKFIDKFCKSDICSNGTIEIINASFIADEATIFGEINQRYVQSELEWYKSQSLNINDMNGKIPEIWKQISSKEGLINSNYGWCIWSEQNGYQLKNCLSSLIKDKDSRQAVMIYIRPEMHRDAFKNGMKDFLCTFSTQFLIRDDVLHQIVFMRSNDAVFGYKNDYHWHQFVFDIVLRQLEIHYPDLIKGNLYWNAGSLHIYPRHINLIEQYINENYNE